MKCVFPLARVFVFLSFLASACIGLTSRAEDPSNEIAAKLAS